MHPIQVTQPDYKLLTELLTRRTNAVPGEKACRASLFQELSRARIVSPSEIAPDVITLRSKASLIDLESGELLEYTLVLPEEADASEGLISIFAPLGTAMLGFRQGDIFEWAMPGGVMKLKVVQVMQEQSSFSRKEEE
jgi:regulator of nucleoside diphosphate kinase